MSEVGHPGKQRRHHRDGIRGEHYPPAGRDGIRGEHYPPAGRDGLRGEHFPSCSVQIEQVRIYILKNLEKSTTIHEKSF